MAIAEHHSNGVTTALPLLVAADETVNGTKHKKVAVNDETSHDATIRRFDGLVKAGALYYDYDYVTEMRWVDGFLFEFRISVALKFKPFNPSDSLAGALFKGSGPRPGSDLNIEGLEVPAPHMPPSHFLAFNGFSAYRPHLLILTVDGYRRQWEALNLADFNAAAAVLNHHVAEADRGGERDMLIFFNCRSEAGCSRLHKHLQAMPCESLDGNPWRNLDGDRPPFAYHRDDTCGTDPARLYRAYLEGLAAVERTLGPDMALEGGVPPHNVIFDRNRLVVVPRRAAGIEGLSANSGGLLGLIWVESEGMMQKWLDANPYKLLEAAGVPRLL